MTDHRRDRRVLADDLRCDRECKCSTRASVLSMPSRRSARLPLGLVEPREVLQILDDRRDPLAGLGGGPQQIVQRTQAASARARPRSARCLPRPRSTTSTLLVMAPSGVLISCATPATRARRARPSSPTARAGPGVWRSSRSVSVSWALASVSSAVAAARARPACAYTRAFSMATPASAAIELQDFAVPSRERPRALVEHLDDAGHRPAEPDGHAHDRARLERRWRRPPAGPRGDPCSASGTTIDSPVAATVPCNPLADGQLSSGAARRP